MLFNWDRKRRDRDWGLFVYINNRNLIKWDGDSLFVGNSNCL